MDSQLISEINAGLQRIPEVRLLAPDEAEALRSCVAQRFGFPPGHCWWWEHLPSRVKSVAYGESDGLEAVLAALPIGTIEAYLFLTDDDPPPWKCVCGPVDELIHLLRELPFIECFFVDKSLDWVLFDTHHNAVVGHGEQLRIPDVAI